MQHYSPRNFNKTSSSLESRAKIRWENLGVCLKKSLTNQSSKSHQRRSEYSMSMTRSLSLSLKRLIKKRRAIMIDSASSYLATRRKSRAAPDHLISLSNNLQLNNGDFSSYDGVLGFWGRTALTWSATMRPTNARLVAATPRR